VTRFQRRSDRSGRKPRVLQDNSELQYHKNGYKWGFKISVEGPRHQFFKLELDSSKTRGSSASSGLAKSFLGKCLRSVFFR